MYFDKSDNFNLINEVGEIDLELDNYLQESKLIMESWEKNNEKDIMQKYKNYHSVIQTFLKFYLMSLNLSLNRNRENWTKKEAWLTGINTVTFWRFRASYLIFNKGFPIESISLLRGIFENILTTIALLKDIINTENVFVGILPPNIDLSNKEVIEKELKKSVFKLNERVKTAIIGRESPLSLETRKYFEIIFRVMHNSAHHSTLNVIKHVFPWYQGKKILFPLPMLEGEHLSTYINLSLCLAWIIINLLSKIYEKDIYKINLFDKNYNSLNSIFNKILDVDENKKFIEEFIQSIYP